MSTLCSYEVLLIWKTTENYFQLKNCIVEPLELNSLDSRLSTDSETWTARLLRLRFGIFIDSSFLFDFVLLPFLTRLCSYSPLLTRFLSSSNLLFFPSSYKTMLLFDSSSSWPNSSAHLVAYHREFTWQATTWTTRSFYQAVVITQ